MTNTNFASAKLSVSRQLEVALELRSSGLLTEAVDMLAGPREYSGHLCAVRAETEFALGRFQEAALSFFSVTLCDADDSNAHYNLGLCLERCGRWDVAAEAFERVLQLEGEREDARLGFGACLLHLNRAEEALAIFTQYDRGLNPVPALIGRAVALQLLRRFEEAEMAYSALLAYDPNSQEALTNLIAMAIETDDLKRVRDHSMRLLDICPNSTAALQGLATVAFRGSDYSAAASYCDRILELAPDCLEAWHNFRIAMDQSSFSSSEPVVSFRTGGKP
jgi:tetratricopeptide (TPR) repeat protein